MLKCKRCGDEQEEVGISELDKFCYCGGKLVSIENEISQKQRKEVKKCTLSDQ